MSSAEQTITRLRELKLTSMAQAYELQLQQPGRGELSFEDRFGLLVEFEAAERESRKLKRLVRAAGLPEPAALEDVDHRAGRELDKAQLAALASCDWIRRQQNLIIHGATGVGKTWLACAFATQACRLKMPVVFFRASDLYGEIAVAVLDGSLPKLKLALARPSLLGLDDFGIGEVTTGVGQVLLDVVERRVRTGSLLITSQYPTDQWHGFFPDPTVADAVLDRVVHQSHRLALKGESMRKSRARERMQAK
jgi:DNA replication protein DnaC